MATSLRLTPELESDLKQLADEHERSIHGEMLYALKSYVEEQKLAKARKRAFELARMQADDESIQQM